MRLIKAGRIIADPFVRVADGAPLPDDAPVLVSAARFLDEATALATRTASVGVIWPNDRRIAELAPHLSSLALVALVFPSFRDGRAYSQARQLRERHHFRGEVRATGEVLRDQFLFMLRAGFDAFEVKKGADAEAFDVAISRYSVFYQPAGDLPFAARLRLARAAPLRQAT